MVPKFSSYLSDIYLKHIFNCFQAFLKNDWGIELDYCNVQCFDLGINLDHSVYFEIVHKYCFSYSFVDYEGYSISSKGFLSIVVDIMVI